MSAIQVPNPSATPAFSGHALVNSQAFQNAGRSINGKAREVDNLVVSQAHNGQDGLAGHAVIGHKTVTTDRHGTTPVPVAIPAAPAPSDRPTPPHNDSPP